MSFAFSTMFPITNDNTEYELIEKDHVSFKTFQNKNILLIQPEALKIITENAFYKVSHFYRISHLKLLKKILDDSISGKLVLIFKEKKLLEKLLKQFNKKSKIKYKLYINGHRKDLKKLPLKLERQFSNAYVILNCEQIQRYI